MCHSRSRLSDDHLMSVINRHSLPWIVRLHARTNGLSRAQKRSLIVSWMGR